MKSSVPLLNDRGRFISDPTVSCAVGVVTVNGKRQIAWSVHEGELGPRIYPLSKHDALMLADSLVRAAQTVEP